MRRTVIIESGALVVLGAVGWLGGLSSFLRMDARMQSSSLKPGVYVMIISAALVITALAYAWLSLRKMAAKPSANAREPREAWASRAVVLVFGTVALYACLIPLVGYLPSTVLFLLAQFRVLGVMSWWRNAILTVVVSAIFFVVFIHYGGMIFPQGGWLE